MQRLPIGEQNFEVIRRENMFYVDKTAHVHHLITHSRYNFLSRPRRFGKSLTLSTIDEIFCGKKALFKGLWIENNWDWLAINPVIHLSFNKLDLTFRPFSSPKIKLKHSFCFVQAQKSLYFQILFFKHILALRKHKTKNIILIFGYNSPFLKIKFCFNFVFRTGMVEM